MSKIETRFHSCNRKVVVPPRRARAARPLVVAGALLAGLCAAAPIAPRPEALIKWRQSAYQVIAWNSSRIKSSLAGDFNSREVQSAANALAAVANSGLTDLFAPGTADGKGWRETAARDEVFSDAQQFRAQGDEFARESAALARIAASGDRAAINAQFLKVANACKSCHDKYRQTD